MRERQKRLKEVYEHVRRFFGIHTQEDFAKSLHKSRNAITLALNGNEKYLTDNLFVNICEAFPNVFNLDYLLSGEGELLAPHPEDSTPFAAEDATPAPFIPSWADAFFDIMTQQIKQNEALNRELRTTIAEVNSLKSDLAAILKSLKK